MKGHPCPRCGRISYHPKDAEQGWCALCNGFTGHNAHPELVEDLARRVGALAIRELPDGSIACVQKLMATTSLMLGVDEWSWRYRFCYERPEDALAALKAVQSELDIPTGWIACRPEVRVVDTEHSYACATHYFANAACDCSRGKPRYPTPDELRQLRAKARGA